MARQEKDFQAEIHRSLRSLPNTKFYHKIVDNGFTNPFDAVMTYDAVSYAMEYKISKGHVSIPLYELFKGREHEIRELLRVKRSGGRSYVLVNVFVARIVNVAYVFEIDHYLYLCRRILPKKSIKLNDPILSLFPQLEKIKTDTGPIWDLNPIINYGLQATLPK